MKQNSWAAMSVKQKTFVGVMLAIVLALFGGVALLVPTWKTPAKAETPTISGWYVNTDTAEQQTAAEGDLISVKLKGASTEFSLTTSYAADLSHAYVAVKYSGTATFSEMKAWGSKNGTPSAKNGLTVAAIGTGWNVTKTIGMDFSVVVAQIGGYYLVGELDIDTVTNIGFAVTGNADDTFIIHGIEVLADGNHSLGTPTPFPIEGDLTVGDMVATENTASPNPLTVTKADGEQTVSFSAAPGWNTITAQVSNYTSDYKFLYLEFTANDKFTMSVRAGSETYLTTPWTQELFESGRKTRVVDLSEQTLTPSFQLVFCFNANENPGSEYSTTEPKTIVFHEISFMETDPTASTEPNHFRTPTGAAGVVYTESDKKVSYTNTADAYYRYLEVLLENHDTAYDVLSIDITGYNGLVLGVRVLYNDELEGEITAATLDVIPSDAYYSKIETADRTEIVIYLEAYGLKGCEVTGVQLYLDAPANAGKVGDVEITLNNIEVLNSTTLAPASTAITASDATITEGETPDFGVALKAGDTDVNGKIITEYRSFGATGAYTAGLPTAAGEYEVRFYYMGSREYKFTRTTTAKLTVNAAPVTPTKTLSSITVTTQPTKKTYTVGDTLDLTGLVVTATYSDETTEAVTVTTAMLSDYDMSKAGTYTVKVTYEGQYTTFEIKVNAKAPADNNNGGNGLKPGAIAGIVVGCIAAVAVIAVVVVIVLKKKKN